MSTHCNLAVMMLLMTFHGQVYAGRIFGGHKVVPHSRPYMVLVRGYWENDKKSDCGGFLINEDFVMTAAHCRGSTFTVWLGVDNATKMNDNVQQIEVEQSFPHKDFNRTGLINDVMLLKLGSKAKFNSNVKPIHLAVKKEDESLPKPCNVCGWGRVDNTNPGMSSILMEVNITLISNMKCEQQNAYCSKGVDGPREGDSGGPLVCEDTMAYGVVSGMLNSKGQPLYKYTRIPDYMDWIFSITENNRN